MASRLQDTRGARLSVEAAHYYARIYASARTGCLEELRRAGCRGEEAEDIFATTFERIMRKFDPADSEYAPAQMVTLLKQACAQKLIDERRHRDVIELVPLQRASRHIDRSTEGPEETAEEREEVGAAREAIASLSERDRALFMQRHRFGLSPEEILARNPGLSLRTYRKVMQRANTRALAAFGEIGSGARCEQMQDGRLRRYAAGEAEGQELAIVEAHLNHCRGCQLDVAGMREHLHDVAAGLAAALGGDPHGDRLASWASRALEAAGHGGEALLGASRTARERLRELALRAATSLPGSGGDTAVGQLAGVSGAKAISACAAGAIAAGCLAAGVVPGVGALELAQHHRHREDPPRQSAIKTPPPTVARTTAPTAMPSESQTAQPSSTGEASKSAAKGKTSSGASSEPRTHPSARPTTSASQVATEFGVESAGTGTPVTSTSTESSAGGDESSSGEASVGASHSAGGSGQGESAAAREFGL